MRGGSCQLGNLTYEDVPGPGYSERAVSVFFRDRFIRAISPAEKLKLKKKGKKVTVAAAHNVVLAFNTFYF